MAIVEKADLGFSPFKSLPSIKWVRKWAPEKRKGRKRATMRTQVMLHNKINTHMP